MSAPTTIERSFAEQHAFNRQVWERLVNDPSLNDTAAVAPRSAEKCSKYR